MIAGLTLTAATATMPHQRAYRLTIHGTANALVAVRANGPKGWIEALCTAKTCAIGHSVVRLSRNGSAVALVHVYRISDRSPRSGVVAVRAADAAASSGSAVLRYLRMTL
jgi:hypothetical protein